MIACREATEDDVSFIAEIILLAESTGFEITSYEKMFNMPATELKPYFEKIIRNNTVGHPLTWRSYLIATVDDIPAAAISAYMEGSGGDSNHMMTGALMSGFSREQVMKAFGFLKSNQDISIPKKKGSMQIDCVATIESQRGKGLLKLLVNEAEKRARESGVNELQIQVWKKNTGAVNAYEKLGYHAIETKMSGTFNDNGKVLMIKKI